MVGCAVEALLVEVTGDTLVRQKWPGPHSQRTAPPAPTVLPVASKFHHLRYAVILLSCLPRNGVTFLLPVKYVAGTY